MRIFGLWGKRSLRLSSPKQEFVIINNRRVYVNGTSYALPNDTLENNRLDLQHFVMQYVMQRPTAIPFDGRRFPYPASVLDVACGTGRWAAEMAFKWPNANVVGVDIKKPDIDGAAITQGHDKPPPNLVIDEVDIRQQLPFADSSFDYTHARFLVVAISLSDWRHVMTELLRVTRPGGWIELVDTNMQAALDTPAFRQFFAWFEQVTARRPYDLNAGSHIASYLKEAGAINIVTSTLSIPFGGWGGRLGGMMAADILAALDGLIQPLVLSHIATQAEAQAVVAQMRADIASEYAFKAQPVVPFTYAYGQKPQIMA